MDQIRPGVYRPRPVSRDLSEGVTIAMDHAAEAARLRLQAEEQDALQAAKQVKEDTLAKIASDVHLANATVALLTDLHKLVRGDSVHVAAQVFYAALRKQLSPLAESYGYKFVLVGDKTKAALTLI